MPTQTCTLQVFIDSRWQDAAAVDLIGDVDRGIDASTYLIYSPQYALSYWDRSDAAALSVNLPVSIMPLACASWPPFLVDLLPQGYGRTELLKQLHTRSGTGPAADWALLCAGAGNPIGNVRVKEAQTWVRERSNANSRGFTMDEVAARAGDFSEYLAQHGLFLAGSSGIQGEWPKIQLTRAHDGLLYLDHALADEAAAEHFIVKFGRGADPSLANILRLEAPYMQLARGLGLNVHGDLQLRSRALFIPRFDRQVVDGKLLRHGQESIASLCEVKGFGAAPTHNQVCRRLGEVASDPLGDIIEYVKRDIANIALGNKDNHARNTAIGRRYDGWIGLTPLFDFAPMWLHPDGIARRIRWEADDDGMPIWASAIDQAAQAAQVPPDKVKAAVRAMATPMSTLLADAAALGIEAEFLQPLHAAVNSVRRQLEQL